jgi:predicted ATPase
MTIKLKINQLAKIENSEVEIKPFNIFFGDSNTNKSYTLFAIYFFYKILKEKPFIPIGELAEYSDFYKMKKTLLYYYEDNIADFFLYLIGYKPENLNLEIKLSDKIPNLELQLFSDTRIFDKIKIFLFPPSRSSIMDIQKILLNMIAHNFNIALSGLIKEFLQTYLSALTPSFPIEDNFEDKTLKNLLIDIFGGEVEHDTSSNETFYKEKNLKIPITATASSIRELAPLYLTLRYNPINQKIYFIEEPEAHLHPSLQRKVAFLLAYIVNKGGKVFITTHSDYLVNTLSNLVKLWFLKQKDEEKAKSIMEKFNIKDEYLLSPDKLGVYFFKKNENGKVNIKNVEINEYGISPESFLNVMNEDIELAEEILEAMD